MVTAEVIRCTVVETVVLIVDVREIRSLIIRVCVVVYAVVLDIRELISMSCRNVCVNLRIIALYRRRSFVYFIYLLRGHFVLWLLNGHYIRQRRIIVSIVKAEIERLYFSASAGAYIVRHYLAAAWASPCIGALIERCYFNVYLLLAEGVCLFDYL